MKNLIASVQKKDDLSKYVPTTGAISNALKAAQEEIDKQNKAAMANELLVLIRQTSRAIESRVKIIREHRAAERRVLKEVKDLNRAMAYGNETGNFIPLICLTGTSCEAFSADAKLREIPKDWEPKK